MTLPDNVVQSGRILKKKKKEMYTGKALACGKWRTVGNSGGNLGDQTADRNRDSNQCS